MKDASKLIEEDAARYASEIDMRISSVEKAIGDITRQQESLNNLLLAQAKKGYYDPARAERLLAPNQLRYGLEGLPPTATNFHPLEVSREGASYRWTGPGSIIELPITVSRQAAHQARLHFVAVAAPSVLETAQIYLDDNLIDFRIEGKYINFEIPADSARFNEALIRIVTGECVVPASLENSESKDTRKLGIALSGLEIRS